MDLDDLIARFRGPLVGLLVGLGNDRQRAVELAQDTFAEAYLSRDRFRDAWGDTRAVGAWLRGIAYRVHLARWRKDRGPRVPRPLDEDLAETLPGQGAARRPESPVLEALDGVRGPWRTVLEMRYLQGAALPEIAAVLGIGVRAVEGRLRRARRELRTRLENRASAAGAAGGDEEVSR